MASVNVAQAIDFIAFQKRKHLARNLRSLSQEVPMSDIERRLLRHLLVVVALKLVVLTGLWWAFVHDHRVVVQPESVLSSALQTEVGASNDQ
jgi:hypothetical protein